MIILVGYDGSNISRKALLLAQERGNIFGAKIEVVTVIHQNYNIGYEEIQGAEAKLEKEIRSQFKANTIPCKEYLVVSNLSAGEELVEFAEREKIDEIIIGVKKKSKVGKLVFGSTAQYVILNAPCPVVTIK